MDLAPGFCFLPTQPIRRRSVFCLGGPGRFPFFSSSSRLLTDRWAERSNLCLYPHYIDRYDCTGACSDEYSFVVSTSFAASLFFFFFLGDSSGGDWRTNETGDNWERVVSSSEGKYSNVDGVKQNAAAPLYLYSRVLVLLEKCFSIVAHELDWFGLREVEKLRRRTRSSDNNNNNNSSKKKMNGKAEIYICRQKLRHAELEVVYDVHSLAAICRTSSRSETAGRCVSPSAALSAGLSSSSSSSSLSLSLVLLHPPASDQPLSSNRLNNQETTEKLESMVEGKQPDGAGRGGPPRPPRKPRGHLLPQSHRGHRHRPRARTPANSTVATVPDAKRHRKEEGGDERSSFARLRSEVETPAEVALYLAAHRREVLRTPKALHTFLSAALAGRAASFFDDLAKNFKKELFDLLFGLYSMASTGKMPLSPASHEFIIRCEQCGVRDAAWEADLAAHGVDTSLLTPKAMLKRLGQLDPVGRLQRLLETCATPADLAKCARRLKTRILSPDDDGNPASSSGPTSASEETYATNCQLLSKLVSRIRRLGAAPRGATLEAKEPTPDAPSLSWDETEMAVARASVSDSMELLEHLLKHRPATSTRSPVSKLLRFVEWAQPLGLSTADDVERVRALQQAEEQALEQTAAQMETVLAIKSVPPGDEAALTEVLDRLWNSGDLKSFRPWSPDVLSCIATAAAAEGISSALQATTARRLTATQAALQAAGDKRQLPRRALRFVQSVTQAEKQVDMAKRIEASRTFLFSPPDCGEPQPAFTLNFTKEERDIGRTAALVRRLGSGVTAKRKLPLLLLLRLSITFVFLRNVFLFNFIIIIILFAL
eukprot:gene11060-7691_t